VSPAEDSSAIELFHFMMRSEFTMVFVFVTMFWTWRCFIEVRVSVKELRAFCFFRQVERKPRRVQQGELQGDMAVESITCGTRLTSLVVLSLRFMVAIILFVDGYVLLCMTQRMIELIMNAIALEFIFDLDDIVVNAMLGRDELNLLGRLHFRHPKPMLGQVYKSVTREPSISIRKWRICKWMRLVLLALITVGFSLPHYLMVRSLHARAKVLCLTNGLTDGTRPLPDDSPEVVFPAPAFCLTLANEYSGIQDESRCSAWRMQVGEPYVFGYCSASGALVDAPWTELDAVNLDISRSCAEMWFGPGPGEGAQARVPALVRKTDSHAVPALFGCHKQDLKVHTKPIQWPFFASGAVYQEVKVTCERPAYGPRSAVWSRTPMDSHEVLPPRYFFRFDPRSPIEHQVGACEELRAFETCFRDPCLVLLDDMGGSSCAQYCEEHNLVCTEAFSGGRGCRTGDSLACDATIPDSGRVVCRCALPPQQRICGTLPYVYARCDNDPCRVLVSLRDQDSGSRINVTSCTAYCALGGLSCIEQYKVHRYSCLRDSRRSLFCDDALEPPEQQAPGPRLLAAPEPAGPEAPQRQLRGHVGHGHTHSQQISTEEMPSPVGGRGALEPDAVPTRVCRCR